jgi:hypothetical protein
MNRSFTITIPEPCSEKWTDMIPKKGGKFCVSCDKIVVDFTKMTDSELLDYFKHYQGGTCGNFNTMQIDRLIQPLPKERRFHHFHRIVATVVGLFLSMSGKTQSSDSLKLKPITEISPLKAKLISLTATTKLKHKHTLEAQFITLEASMSGFTCIKPVEIYKNESLLNTFNYSIKDFLDRILSKNTEGGKKPPFK